MGPHPVHSETGPQDTCVHLAVGRADPHIAVTYGSGA